MCSSDCWYINVCDNVSDNCQKHCAKYLEMSYLMAHSNIPVKKRRPLPLTPSTCDLEAFMRLAEIKDNIGEFVDEGKNLYITSTTVGNGKTSWALKLLMKYFEVVWEGNGFRPRGVIVHVPTFLVKSKDFKTVDPEFEELKKLLLTVDLVVWDDIGANNISEYDYSQLLMYLDARDFAVLSNIFTGNITDKDKLESALGAKLVSRIWNSNTEIIQFNGGERR